MEKILEDINKIALKFLTPYSPNEMYRIIVEEGKKLVKAEHGSIFLHKDDSLERVYASSELLYQVKVNRKGYAYEALLSTKPIVLPLKEIKKIHPLMDAAGIKSIVLIPLSYKNDTIGVLAIDSLKEEYFTSREMHILKLFGSMASMAIKKTHLYDETKKALEIRDLFISLASHELRTPLTSINGYVQLLHNKFAKKDTVEAKWVKQLYDESIRLTNLVKELLEVNRMKQGQLQYNLLECRVEDFVEVAVKRYSFINPERKIIYNDQLSIQDVKIIGDNEKLLQMVTALLNNADKFSPKKETIEVIVKNTKSHLFIQIKDKGEGIAREDIFKVFDGFYKTGNKQSEGLGVGLLLAKHIIQYHHGSIDLKSKVNKGTTVEVKLPLLK